MERRKFAQKWVFHLIRHVIQPKLSVAAMDIVIDFLLIKG